MRGRHCLKAWTMKQQVESLSTAESELHTAVKTASEGLGIQSVAKDLGIARGPNPTSGYLSDDVPCQPRRIGQS